MCIPWILSTSGEELATDPRARHAVVVDGRIVDDTGASGDTPKFGAVASARGSFPAKGAEKLHKAASQAAQHEEAARIDTPAEAINEEAEGLKAPSLFSFTVKDPAGNDVSLQRYKGMVTLIVNVASSCGFTEANYEGLTDLFQRFHARGLEILAFPCNQFGSQEPRSAGEVQQWAREKYHVAFPIFAKVEVNGGGEDPLFTWLKTTLAAQRGADAPTDLKWNFQKFLVGRDGRPVTQFASEFDDASISAAIEELL